MIQPPHINIAPAVMLARIAAFAMSVGDVWPLRTASGKIYSPKKTLIALGYLEKLDISFKIDACEKFNRRYIVDIPRIKF
jgi:hypothetical protein